jgi:hypothetical protein
VCHLGVKRKEELEEEEEAKQPSLCPKELSLDEDETAKIPDYEQNKRQKATCPTLALTGTMSAKVQA